MSAITKAAAIVLASGLLSGLGTVAAFASETTDVSPVVTVDETVVVTWEQVVAAKAAFEQARADALAAEKLAHAQYQAAEKALGDAAKTVKGTAKKPAQVQVQDLRAVNQASLDALQAANRVAVDEAKAAYQAMAAAYEAQNPDPAAAL